MDPVTHALAGCTVALGLKPDVPRWALLATAVLAGNAPDVDFVSRAFGARAYFAIHHGLTHSALVAAGLGVVVAVLVGSFAGEGAVFRLMPLAIICSLVHLMLDWITPWGGPLLWPVSSTRFDVAIVPFFDILLTVLMLGGTGLALRWPDRSRWIVGVAWLLVLVYFGARGLEMRKAERAVRAQAGAAGSEVSDLRVFAPPLGVRFFTWGVAVRSNEKLHTYRVNTQAGTCELEQVSDAATAEDLERVAGSDAVRILSRQFGFISVSKGAGAAGEEWLWESAAVLPGADYRLSAKTVFDANGDFSADDLNIDIRGFYQSLIDKLWPPED